MNKQKLVILIIAAVGAISTFLPWAKVEFGGSISINGTNGGDGWITFGLFAVAGAMAFLGDKTKPLSGIYKTITLITGLIASVIGILNIVNIKSELSEISSTELYGDQLKDIVSLGFGLWLIVISGLALVAVIFLLKEKKSKVVPNDIQKD